ncbi:DM13 domain-containing protein [Promicromonospora sukumoe]|uniref:DM13 domain-containing protein n=1 Tax=Promicromonospora sukumoe TaxID=88382 RepID=UPI00036DB0FE|nr:DM13 domain-containing protein [Promicromonospora sukumoe]
MRKTALASAAVLTATLLLTGCGADDGGSGDAMSDQTSSSQEQSEDMGEDMGEDMTEDMGGEARTGTFEGLNDKAVAGTVEVSDSEIVLSGYSSDEGPDLHIYLTNGTDEAAVAAGTQIDAVAFDEASQTFALDGVDVAGYDTVVIHCDKAKAVFGAAPLA